MSFAFVDSVVRCEVGKQIVAIKCLTLGEDYLRDHFPMFPVMPGVLMLESMFQAAAWLLRATDDFSQSMVLLKQARHVKYSGFVRPGQSLTITASLQQRTDHDTSFRAQGIVGANDAPVVGAHLTLESYNLADRDPDQAPMDRYICQQLRREWEILLKPEPIVVERK